MSVEQLYEKARFQLGATPEIRLKKARLRTIRLNKVLRKHLDAMNIPKTLLDQKVTL